MNVFMYVKLPQVERQACLQPGSQIEIKSSKILPYNIKNTILIRPKIVFSMKKLGIKFL